MQPLLQHNDSPAVEVVNPNSNSPLILVCEHAGNLVPHALNNLGLSDGDLQKHIAWDIGIAQVARQVAQDLDVTLILQNYSRLVIDCNRPPHTPDSIPKISDRTEIYGNQNLSESHIQSRIDEIFTPYDNAVRHAFARGNITCAVSIHSYTRQMVGDDSRPWDVGFLARQNMTLNHHLYHHYQGYDTGLRVAINQPYQIEQETDWFIVQYGEGNTIDHTLVEICNDQLLDHGGVIHHAHLLATGLQSFMEKQ